MKYIIPLALLLSACSDNNPKLTENQYWDIINNSKIVDYCKNNTVLIREHKSDVIYIDKMVAKKVKNKDKPCEEVK